MSQYQLETINYTEVHKEIKETIEHWHVPVGYLFIEKPKRKKLIKRKHRLS